MAIPMKQMSFDRLLSLACMFFFLVGLAVALPTKQACAQTGMAVDSKVEDANFITQLAKMGDEIAQLGTIFTVLNQLYVESGLKDYLDKVRARLLNDAANRRTQAALDQQYQILRAGKEADTLKDHIRSQYDNSCSTGVALTLRDQMNVMVPQLARALQGAAIKSRGTGPGACETCSSASALDIATYCAIDGKNSGVFDPAIVGGTQQTPGPWMQKANCQPITTPPDSNFVTLFGLVNAITDPYAGSGHNGVMPSPGADEYTLPSCVTMSPDGHIIFSKCPLLGTDLDWAVAYETAQNLVPVMPTPSPGANPTAQNITEARQRERDISAVSAVTWPAFKGVAYRTACPSNNTKMVISSSGGISVTCHDIQEDACNVLKSPISTLVQLATAPGHPMYGLGLNPLEPSLANCGQLGLSLAEYDRLWCGRYKDTVYQAAINSAYDAKEAQHILTIELPRDERECRTRLEAEEKAIQDGAANAVAMRGMAQSSNTLNRQ